MFKNLKISILLFISTLSSDCTYDESIGETITCNLHPLTTGEEADDPAEPKDHEE